MGNFNDELEAAVKNMSADEINRLLERLDEVKCIVYKRAVEAKRGGLYLAQNINNQCIATVKRLRDGFKPEEKELRILEASLPKMHYVGDSIMLDEQLAGCWKQSYYGSSNRCIVEAFGSTAHVKIMLILEDCLKDGFLVGERFVWGEGENEMEFVICDRNRAISEKIMMKDVKERYVHGPDSMAKQEISSWYLNQIDVTGARR